MKLTRSNKLRLRMIHTWSTSVVVCSIWNRQRTELMLCVALNSSLPWWLSGVDSIHGLFLFLRQKMLSCWIDTILPKITTFHTLTSLPLTKTPLETCQEMKLRSDNIVKLVLKSHKSSRIFSLQVMLSRIMITLKVMKPSNLKKSKKNKLKKNSMKSRSMSSFKSITSTFTHQSRSTVWRENQPDKKTNAWSELSLKQVPMAPGLPTLSNHKVLWCSKNIFQTVAVSKSGFVKPDWQELR